VKSPDKIEQIIHPPNQSMRIHYLAQQAVMVDGTLDNSAALAVQTPPQARTRKRHVVFKNSVYIISDWLGDLFPNVIYIGIDGVNGYKQLSPTISMPMPSNKVAAL
jgi:hypothetical protein